MSRKAHSMTTAVEDFLQAWKDADADTLLAGTPLVEAKNALRQSLIKNRKIRRETIAKAIQSPDHGRPATVDRQKLMKLWRENLSQAAIARELGCSPAGVRFALIEVGNGQLPTREGYSHLSIT